MEILDALEQKVAELIKELAALKARNAELEQQVPGGFKAGPDDNAAAKRIAELEQALFKEKELKKAALQRINALVQHLEKRNSAG
ncbi:cell division protein ZapB [Desulfovibrio sp. OttesenSCG-928-F07]|nr:cell division protein ZapB [Desulfovibrio sp. OttesenSCG-928-F07]